MIMCCDKEEIKTLLIDDEYEILEILSDILRDLPIKIFRAENGRTALDIFEKEQPEIVLTDINLPDMSGIDIIKKMREKSGYVDMYVIALSGMSFQNVRIDAIKAGANEFISKPFSVSELIIRIDNCLKIIRGIKILKNENSKLEEISLIDKFTGFYNSKYLDKRYIEEMSKAYRYKRNISALKIEIDKLSKAKYLPISDKSEYLISKVANITKETMRKCDVVMRTGNNELTMLLPETSSDQASVAAQKIQAKVNTFQISDGEKKIPVCINVGIACNKKQKIEMNGLLRVLDTAFERAKKIGNGSIIVGD